MSDRPSHNLDGQQTEMARRIDQVCRRFEANWREGSRPHIEDYLVDFSHEGRPPLRAELEALERELRQSEKTVVCPDAAVFSGGMPSPGRYTIPPRSPWHRPAPLDHPQRPQSWARRRRRFTRLPQYRTSTSLGLLTISPPPRCTDKIRWPHQPRLNPIASDTSATMKSFGRSRAGAWVSYSKRGR